MLQRTVCAAILLASTACAPALVGAYVGTVTIEGPEGRSKPAPIGVKISSPTAYYLRFATNDTKNLRCSGEYTMTTWSANAFTAVGSGGCDVPDAECGSLSLVLNGGHGELVSDHLTATFRWTAACARTHNSSQLVELYELTKQ
jgi:hypothetical protein